MFACNGKSHARTLESNERKKQMNIEKKIIDEVKRFNEEQKKKVMLIDVESKAWNVDDTSDENPPSGEGPNWDDYWKHWTKGVFEGAVCACCMARTIILNTHGLHYIVLLAIIGRFESLVRCVRGRKSLELQWQSRIRTQLQILNNGYNLRP